MVRLLKAEGGQWKDIICGAEIKKEVQEHGNRNAGTMLGDHPAPDRTNTPKNPERRSR